MDIPVFYQLATLVINFAGEPQKINMHENSYLQLNLAFYNIQYEFLVVVKSQI